MHAYEFSKFSIFLLFNLKLIFFCKSVLFLQFFFPGLYFIFLFLLYDVFNAKYYKLKSLFLIFQLSFK